MSTLWDAELSQLIGASALSKGLVKICLWVIEASGCQEVGDSEVTVADQGQHFNWMMGILKGHIVIF